MTAEVLGYERQIGDIDSRLAAIPIDSRAAQAEAVGVRAGLDQQETRTEAESTYNVVATVSGRIAALPTAPGQSVSAGSSLAIVTPGNGPLEAELYVPSRAAGDPAAVRTQLFGSSSTAGRPGRGEPHHLATITVKPGVKPGPPRGGGRRSNSVRAVAGELGLEPRMTVPKTGVLPLHHSPAGPAFPGPRRREACEIRQGRGGCKTRIPDYFAAGHFPACGRQTPSL